VCCRLIQGRLPFITNIILGKITGEYQPIPGEAAILAAVPPLRRLRRLKGWTQEELAKAAGVSSFTVAYLERGAREPRPGTMARIAKALGVRITEIDEFVEERPPQPPAAPDAPTD
jgi:DNA-binding XRE family transcriptional regulator